MTDYFKPIFQLLKAGNADYQPAENREGKETEYSGAAINVISWEDTAVPASASTKTIAIGTETVIGFFVQNTGAKELIVKWTSAANTNVQTLDTNDEGAWMFVPAVDSSTNITLEGDGGTTTATVFVVSAP